MVLGATLPLPLLQPVGGSLLVMLALAKGVRAAAILAGLAGSALIVVSLVLGDEPMGVVILMATICLPLLALAAVFVATRSLTLTLQVSVLVVALGLIGFGLWVEDASAFWQPFSTIVMEAFRQNNDLQSTIAVMEANPDLLARMMTLVVALGSWMNFSLSVILGHYLFQQLPDNSGRYGRFCDLNFGRVIASALVLASVLSYITGVELIENVAIVLFAIFWVQGLALVHWMRAERKFGTIAVVTIYLSHLFLHVIIAVPMAIAGYLDAWFDVRRRIDSRSN